MSGAFLYVRNRFPSLLYLLVMMLDCVNAVLSKTQTSKLQTSDLENSDLETSDLENSDLENSDPLKNDMQFYMNIFLHDNYYRD